VAETLRAEIVRILYQRPSGFTVLAMRTVAAPPRRFVAVGELPPTLRLAPTQAWTVLGDWEDSPRYGRRFRIGALMVEEPATPEAIEALLASGLIAGVGPARAKRIVAHFGAETWTVLTTAPERLAEVPGLGPAVCQTILASWRALKQPVAQLAQLCARGLSPAVATRVVRQFGLQAVEILDADPYRLIEVRGIGFRTADALAQRRGLARDDPARLCAGLREILRQARTAGHVYLPAADWIHQASRLVEVPSPLVASAAQRLIAAAEVIEEDDRAFIAPLYQMERRIERRLAAHLQRPLRRRPMLAEPWLTDEQRQAVLRGLTCGVSIITGLPGTGKTRAAGALLRAAQAAGDRVLLAAPTGKAAKRLGALAGAEAMTIHRLLDATADGRFARHAERPLEADLVLIDEASMLDLELADSLIAALGPETQLVLIGDPHQLPPIGPGQVLQDLIRAGWIPVTELRAIHRQAAQSPIVALAHQIHQGIVPALPPADREADVQATFCVEAQALATHLQALLPTLAARWPLEEIQVLSPMRKGPLGVYALNQLARPLLNPQASETSSVGGFCVGDRVVQRVNNYQKGVFNGDIGRVTVADPEQGQVVVQFGSTPVSYLGGELEELELAYAMTVHKAQGSEYACVVVVLHHSQAILLQRELLYTAVTRARERLILLASPQALHMAIRRTDRQQRYTSLGQPRLQPTAPPVPSRP
jgi:exodeoxyribonuclease V alpha subunit